MNVINHQSHGRRINSFAVDISDKAYLVKMVVGSGVPTVLSARYNLDDQSLNFNLDVNPETKNKIYVSTF